MSAVEHPLEILVKTWQAVDAGEPVDFDAVRASMAAAEDQVEAFSRHAGDPYWADYFGAVTRAFEKVVDRLEEGDGEGACEAFRAALRAGADLPDRRRRLTDAKARRARGRRRRRLLSVFTPW